MTINKIITKTLDALKAKDIVTIDVRKHTSITDSMIICTGTSNRHVKSLANEVVEKLKAAGYPIIGVEGEESAQWILVDAGSAIVHIMQQECRDFYQLEKLWDHED